jgi:hypothetical protein
MTRITHYPRRLHGVHDHRSRLAAAAGAAAVIAAGGYGAVQKFASDTAAAPQPASVIGRAAADSQAPANAEALRELRDSVARQYGSADSDVRTPTGAEAREMRERFARLYGQRR